MGLTFFNTLTRRKEQFVPIKEGEVKLYTCGPTVYDYAHIGNFRAYIFEDLLRRYLKYRRYKVTQVMNITDVEDKTIRASRDKDIPLSQHTEQYTKAFFEDLDTLNIERAEYYPKATEHIQEMVDLIAKLLKKGYGYKSEDGSIYYDISKFENYGKLANVDIGELKAGARVKHDEYTKESAADFALWKAWDEADGDVFWETPFGKGRPGWHIECSVMSMKYLGETFDIHTGGVDLIFPHHQNEIAQAEAATGKKFVNYWLHNEHLIVENRKMSKSLGNYYTLRDLLAKGYTGRQIRYLLLATHYRSPLNFTFGGLDAARNGLQRIDSFLERLQGIKKDIDISCVDELIVKSRKEFIESLDNDLNISAALSSVFSFIWEVDKLIEEGTIGRGDVAFVEEFLREIDGVLGFIYHQIREFEEESVTISTETGSWSIIISTMTPDEDKPTDEKIRTLLKDREKARKEGNWELADSIRNEILEMGYIIEDTAAGPRYRKKWRG